MSTEPTSAAASTPAKYVKKEVLRLHIGGETVREGWKILNIQSKPGVDFIGNCLDLSQFADGTVSEIYASHTYEHLDYVKELPLALREAFRVLVPGGMLRAGVPDLEILCRLFLEPRLDIQAKFFVMRMMFGGQIDAFDYHKVGLSADIFGSLLAEAGFKTIRRVPEFGLFQDITTMKFAGVPISLNLIALKP
jgi:predicted SAM-dependent methyltransferase